MSAKDEIDNNSLFPSFPQTPRIRHGARERRSVQFARIVSTLDPPAHHHYSVAPADEGIQQDVPFADILCRDAVGYCAVRA